MRHKRAESSDGVTRLDPAWLKPGCKASATSKCRRLYGDTDNETENPKRDPRAAICDHVRSSVSSSASGSMQFTCA